MLTRRIPATGEPIPVLGIGTWQSFDIGHDPAERSACAEVLRRLFRAGGRLIDTSPMYGRAESVIGDLLTAMRARERAFIATKVWTKGREDGIEQIRRSATLLRTETIDLVQVHNLLDWRTHLPTLRRMKEDGRIRYIGVTHYTTAALGDLAEIIAREAIDFVQCAYSIATRAAEHHLFPVAADRGVAVIVNRPLEDGGLFEKTRGRPLPPLAAEIGAGNWSQFFLRFILSHPAVTCVIPATRDPQHMTDNLGAAEGPLPDARQRAEMARYWDTL
ncbi:MAG: aldo/keto reductase [Rhodospirillales bacterium]|nr:aldo/keto reductase [Rhodospirillales bacterium]